MSGDFINRYNFDDKTIIWLDYATPSDLNAQLNEIVNLVTKLKPKDIFKITLNANPEALGKTRANEIQEHIDFKR
ncbi:hypothetical protein ECZU31_17540 [Escherichia coli]|nr:hypothetical protein ECZU31_17540 [Escherichia coli]